jgi:hypothetical protein
MAASWRWTVLAREQIEDASLDTLPPMAVAGSLIATLVAECGLVELGQYDEPRFVENLDVNP